MSSSSVVVVGGSVAGFKVAQALRARGHEGPLVLLSDEQHPPYDRPPLSKEFLAGTVADESLALAPTEWYAASQVELRLGHTATGLDPVRHLVHVGEEVVPYDHVVIATGARPRTLPAAQGLSGVHHLRTRDDALGLRAELDRPRRVTVIGGGFIGFEVASTLLTLGHHVVVVEAAAAPLARSLDARTAELLVHRAVEHGADVRAGVTVTALTADTGGRVSGVDLSDGQHVATDLVVVGIGAVPNSEWLADSGLVLVDGGGVVTDRTGRAAPGVWAVGDVAAWADSSGTPKRHEHWTSAQDQARAVAAQILDPAHAAATSPAYVWSDQFGLRLTILGDPTQHDQISVTSHDLDTLATLYAADNRLVGACLVGQPRVMAQCRAWISQGASITDIPLWAPTQTDAGELP